MEQNLITIEQLPIIVYEKIENVGQEIEKRITSLELDKQLVTEDTKKALKDTRATLNKEFENFETQRKQIKEKIQKPYIEFENAYNKFIKVHYENAEQTLKTKINEFDKQIIADKEARIREYFTELCQSNKIDFLPFSKIGLKINISTSDKSLKDRVNEVIEKIKNDLSLVNNISENDEFKAEILTEYKQTFDISTSIHNAQYRKQQREAELQRIEAQKAQAEQARLEAEAKAKEVAPLQAPEVVKPQEQIVKNEAVPAPQEVTPKLIQTTFSVQGTLEQLKALKAYILSNNIKIIE